MPFFSSLFLGLTCGLLKFAGTAAANAGIDRNLGKLILVDTSNFPGARCLDGSPGAAYYRPADGDTSSPDWGKWVFYMEGGGECVDVPSCLGRANTTQGSSNAYPSKANMHHFTSGNPTANPVLNTWHHVFIKYCSGDLHSGTMTEPNATTSLQMSGHLIVAAILETAMTELNQGVEPAMVVVSGASAGGLGAFINMDYMRDWLMDRFGNQVQVLGAPIGGFYFSNSQPYTGDNPVAKPYIPWTFEKLQGYYQFWQSFVPIRCAKMYPTAPHKCLFAIASYATLQTEVFIIEAQTDKVVMPLHDGLPNVWSTLNQSTGNYPCNLSLKFCPPQIVHYFQSWKAQMAQALPLNPMLRNTTGLYHPACLMHVEFDHIHPLMEGLSYAQAFVKWAFGGQQGGLESIRLVDDCGVLCNPSCPDPAK